jgi:glycosyltransferase involved in cell wall biosynthesis
VTAASVDGLARAGWKCAVAAPSYPAAAHEVWSRDSAGEGRAGEVFSFASLPVPLYPELRLARPRVADLGRLIDRFRPDLVHCETEFGVGRAGKAAAQRAGLPVVSSYHTDFARYTEAYGARWLKGVVSRYIARFHQTSRRVYTPSTVARQDLLRLGLTDVEVWGRGVDIELFHPGRRGEALRAALAESPELVKPNREEAEALTGVPVDGAGSASEAARLLFDAGAGGVAISLGAEGMFWQESRDAAPLVARPPRVESRSAVGCGDASVAGFAVAHRRGLAGREFVKFAAACGTANCLADAPGMIDRRQVERLLPQSSVEGVNGRD